MNTGPLHGNYCGSGWSAGKHQNSTVDPTVQAVDELDQCCLDHDAEYYYDEDLDKADLDFAECARKTGLKGKLFAAAVNFNRIMARRPKNLGKGSRQQRRNKASAAKVKARKTVVKEEKKAIQTMAHMASRKQNRGRSVRRGGSGPKTGGAAPLSVGIPRIKPYFRHRGNGDTMSCEGVDYIGSLTSSPSGNQPGDNLFVQNLHPKDFLNSRLAMYCLLYEKYKFASIEFHYVPTTSANSAGSLIGAIVPDPEDPLQVGTANIQLLTSLAGEQAFRVWDDARSIRLVPKRDVPFLFTDKSASDDRLTSQGSFRIAALSSLTSGMTLGNLFVKYRVVFNGVANEIGSATKYAIKAYNKTANNNVAETIGDYLDPNRGTTGWPFASNTSMYPVIAFDSNTSKNQFVFYKNGMQLGDLISISFTEVLSTGGVQGVITCGGTGWTELTAYTLGTSSGVNQLNFRILQVTDTSGYFTFYKATPQTSDRFTLVISRFCNNGITYPQGIDQDMDQKVLMLESRLQKLISTLNLNDAPIICPTCQVENPDHHPGQCPKRILPSSGSRTPNPSW